MSRVYTHEFSGLYERRFYLASIAIGLILLGVGIFIPYYGIVLQGIGGAILGAALSNFLTLDNRLDFDSKIYGLLRESFRCQFLSEENAVKEFASMSTLYHYHITRTKARPSGVWTMTLYNFSRSGAPNVLECEAVVKTSDQIADYTYRVEAGVRDSRLILIASPKCGKERPWIEIYPAGGTFFERKWIGLMLSENYQHRDHFSACILSQDPLISQREHGFIRSEADERTLEEIWKAEFGLQFTYPQ